MAGEPRDELVNVYDASGAGVGDERDGAGDRDDEQRGGDGWLRPLTGEVDQHGQGKNGAAAAEQPEQEADGDGGGMGGREAHGPPSSR